MRDSELVIRASQGDAVWELIPDYALEGDFPLAFVRDYAHWQELETEIIEWRPLVQPWAISQYDWHLRSDGIGKSLTRGSLKIVDVRSSTARALSSLLSPL